MGPGIDDDEDDMTVKLGISEFIRAEYGDIVKVVLSNRKTIANSRSISRKGNPRMMMIPHQPPFQRG